MEIAPDNLPLSTMHIIESPHLVKTRLELRQRTWFERLFTRPWQPFKTHAHVPVQEPDMTYYLFGLHSIICHPAAARALRAQAAERSESDANQNHQSK